MNRVRFLHTLCIQYVNFCEAFHLPEVRLLFFVPWRGFKSTSAVPGLSSAVFQRRFQFASIHHHPHSIPRLEYPRVRFSFEFFPTGVTAERYLFVGRHSCNSKAFIYRQSPVRHWKRSQMDLHPLCPCLMLVLALRLIVGVWHAIAGKTHQLNTSLFRHTVDSAFGCSQTVQDDD